MTRTGLVDSYRSIHKWGGFTWGRDNPSIIRSRLDHIMIDKKLLPQLVQGYTNKCPNESDHHLLYIEIEMEEVRFGPGIQRCNSSLLNNIETHKEIENKLQLIKNDIPDNWNPHQKLDYMKMKAREVIMKEGKKQAKQDKIELEYYNEELNTLDNLLEKKLIEANNENNESKLKKLFKEIDNIKESIEIIEQMLDPIKEKHTKSLIFRAKAKWAEDGEKSTKYFMNLLKDRQRKLQIRKIIANGTIMNNQNEIEKEIQKFYKNLYKKVTT
jgi:hypothetical protein